MKIERETTDDDDDDDDDDDENKTQQQKTDIKFKQSERKDKPRCCCCCCWLDCDAAAAVKTIIGGAVPFPLERATKIHTNMIDMDATMPTRWPSQKEKQRFFVSTKNKEERRRRKQADRREVEDNKDGYNEGSTNLSRAFIFDPFSLAFNSFQLALARLERRDLFLPLTIGIVVDGKSLPSFRRRAPDRPSSRIASQSAFRLQRRGYF